MSHYHLQIRKSWNSIQNHCYIRFHQRTYFWIIFRDNPRLTSLCKNWNVLPYTITSWTWDSISLLWSTLGVLISEISSNISPAISAPIKAMQGVPSSETENYMVVNWLLFWLHDNKHHELTFVLCIPKKYIRMILHSYHDTVLAGHLWVQVLFKTLRQKFFWKFMFQTILEYVRSCHKCQISDPKDKRPKANCCQIPEDWQLLKEFSIDIKYMPNSNQGYHLLLVYVCKHSNWITAVPLTDESTASICEALFYKVICIFGAPRKIIFDAGKPMQSQLMAEPFEWLKITPITISVDHHGSLWVECYIQTIANKICKELTGQGADCPLFVYPCCYTMNMSVSPQTGVSLYELVFHQPPPSLVNLEADFALSAGEMTLQEYIALMQECSHMYRKMMVEHIIQTQQKQLNQEETKFPHGRQICTGDLVMFHFEKAAEIQTDTKKFVRWWVGPALVIQVLDKTHFLLSDLLGRMLPVVFHHDHIKPYYLRMAESMIMTLEELQHILKKEATKSKK